MPEDEFLERLATLVEGWDDDPESSHDAEDRLMRVAIRAAMWTRLADALDANAIAETHWYA